MATKTIVPLSTDQGVGNRPPTDTDVFIGDSGSGAGNVPFHFTGTQLKTYVANTAANNITIIPHSAGDTRTAAQNILDAASPGDTVQLEAGQVYEVSHSGQAIFFGRSTPVRICLFIPEGVIFDGNGSTIRLLDTQNAYLFGTDNLKTNTGSGSTGPTVDNADITIKNLVVDGNRANQSGSADFGAVPAYEEFGGLALQRCPRLKLFNIHIKDCQAFGARVLNCRGGNFDLLSAEDIRGDAFQFGLAENSGVPLECFDCTIGQVNAVRLEEGFDFPGSGRSALQGNPIIANFVGCVGGHWFGRNCAGFKLENLSRDCTFSVIHYSGEVIAGETDFRTNNSGIKLQGATGLIPSNITIGQIFASDCLGEGLRITDVSNWNIGSYTGKNNGANVNQDIFIDDPSAGGGNTFGNLGNILFDGIAGTAGMLIRSSNSRINFGQINAVGLGGGVDLIRTNSASNMTILISSVIMDGGDEVIDDSSTNIYVRVGRVALTSGTSQAGAGDNGGSIQFGEFVNNR